MCHILPPKVVGTVDKKLLGDQHLVLPSLMPNERYRAFYRDWAGIDWITLDNGVAEGDRFHFEHILAMARMANVQEVILPDVLKDSDKTLEDLIQWYYEAINYRNSYRFMFVPQGRTISEIIHCAEQALNMAPGLISTFGIPRHILDVSPSARAQAVMGLRERCAPQAHYDIHLLGTHPDEPSELMYYGEDFKSFGVRSVDTSMAWNATLQGIRLNGPKSLRDNSIKRQSIEDFKEASFDHADPRYKDLLHDNMEAINSWVM